MAEYFTKNCQWSKQKCLKLIKEFRKRPSLWDPKHYLYYKSNCKPAIWDEIGKTIDAPGEQCRNKMSILLSSFRREKSKIINSIGGKNDEVYTSTWFGFKDLSFLMDKEAARKRRTEEGDEALDDMSDDSITTVNETKKATKRKITEISFTPEIDEVQTITEIKVDTPSTSIVESPQTSSAIDEEEIKTFTSFLATKMRKYSDYTKNAVQREICDIIFKADSNYYDKKSYTEIMKQTRSLNEEDPLMRQDDDFQCMINVKNEDCVKIL